MNQWVGHPHLALPPSCRQEAVGAVTAVAASLLLSSSLGRSPALGRQESFGEDGKARNAQLALGRRGLCHRAQCPII